MEQPAVTLLMKRPFIICDFNKSEEEHIALTRLYVQKNHLFYDEKLEPIYSKIVEIDLSTIVPVFLILKRPQDLIELTNAEQNFKRSYPRNGCSRFWFSKRGIGGKQRRYCLMIMKKEIKTGHVAIAAITSCTNTSNPYVLMAAGLVAKRAVEKGCVFQKQSERHLHQAVRLLRLI